MATSSARKASARAAGPSSAGKSAKPARAAGDATGSTAQPGLADQLKQQHRDVEALLTQPDAEQDLSEIVEKICSAWIPHTVIEEQIIIPALQQGGADEPAIAEAEVRRDLVKLLLADLRRQPDGPEAAAKFAVLGSEIEQLIAIEERPDTGLLALAAGHDVDLEALQPQVEACKSELASNTEGDSMNALEPTSLRLHGSGTERQEEEYSSMPNNSNVRERDERGRFESDDDRRGYSSRGNDRERDDQGRFVSDDDRGYRSRSSRDYDDDYRRSGSNGGGPGRDEEGRFTSGGYASRSSRYDDDDRRGGGDRDRGRGGWFSDPRGHSEASRRGWESREGAGYSSRSSRYDDDDRRGNGDRDRGHGGWFGDPRGHAEAAREGWDDRRGAGYSSRSSRYDDDDRRGGGEGRGRGWYGDAEGHSEAAREGWDDRRGYSSRSSRDDDDDRRGGGGGHGGWFGDPEGHSEASRRGWEDRR